MIFNLCSTKILEYSHMRTTPQTFAQCFSHFYTTANHYDINILRRALQENIAYISTDHIAFQSQFICRLGYPFKYVVTKMLFQFFCCQLNHNTPLKNNHIVFIPEHRKSFGLFFHLPCIRAVSSSYLLRTYTLGLGTDQVRL